MGVVLVERPDAHAGDFGDARRRRGVEALAVENLHRRVENGVHRRDGAGLARLAQRRLARAARAFRLQALNARGA